MMSMNYLKLAICLAVMMITGGCVAEEERKFIFDTVEKLHESDDFHMTLKVDGKEEENNVKVNGEMKQMVELNDDWKVDLEVLSSEKKDGEFEEVFKFPTMGICEMMTTLYKDMIYEKIKDYSNAPDPETCPLPAQTYTLTDYPFDGGALKNYLIPGYYRIIGKLSKGNVVQVEYVMNAHVE